jgi:hypothetical protein
VEVKAGGGGVRGIVANEKGERGEDEDCEPDALREDCELLGFIISRLKKSSRFDESKEKG